MPRIDINADVGELTLPNNDAGLMKAITSANIAAGFHAGNPTLLHHTIRLAKAAGVAVGAHPGFPDREGFGRREIHLTQQEVEDLVLYQVAAVAGVAAAEGLTIRHVKPHGALYNMAARDADLAAAIARAVAMFDRALILVGPPRSEILRLGEAAGLRVASEVFADRAYEPDGSLMPRSKPGAVIHDPEVVVSRALTMVTAADTICVHGDTPGADRLAALLRARLESAGVIVTPLGTSF